MIPYIDTTKQETEEQEKVENKEKARGRSDTMELLRDTEELLSQN